MLVLSESFRFMWEFFIQYKASEFCQDILKVKIL